jgi:tetratricopeptide (TPR) repeat protein
MENLKKINKLYSCLLAALLFGCQLCFAQVGFQPGIELVNHGNYKEALSYFEENQTNNKENPDYLYYHAISQYRNDMAKESIKTIERAIKKVPNNADYQFALSTFYLLRIGEVSVVRQPFMVDNVLDPLKKAAELDPSHIPANAFYTGWLLNAPGVAGGDVDKGKARLPELEKLNKSAWFSLRAGLANKEERFDEAESLYLDAIKENGNSASAQISLANFYLEQKQYEKAIEHARLFLSLKRSWSEAGDARGHSIIAQALHHLGDSENSKKEVSLALTTCWNKVEREELEKMLKKL